MSNGLRIKAYVMAADPAWIEASILSYYDQVEEIIVVYDRNKRGWTGAPIEVDTCIDRCRAVDRDGKIRLLPGDFARLDYQPLENDTYQRQYAIDAIGASADWIMQLDADELLPDSAAFVRRLREDVPPDYSAVDWPMRTFFNRTDARHFLEICSLGRKQVSAYPGPIAVRSGTRLETARQTAAACRRFEIRATDTDPAAGMRPVHRVISEEEAILHLSWIRSEEEIRNKLKSWGHSGDFDWKRYLDRVWLAAPQRWRWLYRFHPFSPKWWPALRRVELPANLLAAAVNTP